MAASVADFMEQLKQTLDEEINRIAIKERGTHGWVTRFADGVAEVGGLLEARIGQTLRFVTSSERAHNLEEGGAPEEPEIFGVVEDIDQDVIQCLVFGEEKFVMQGDLVEVWGEQFTIPVTHHLLGRVVDPFCRPLDSSLTGTPDQAEYLACSWLDFAEGKSGQTLRVRPGVLELPIERKAPGVTDRAKVQQQLHTGMKAVDAMLPIGKGQRMLLIGDRSTGKTSFALDTIIRQNELNRELNPALKPGEDRTTWFLNHRKETVYCVYVGIGKKASEIDQIRRKLKDNLAMDYTIIVTSMANDPATLSYISPFTGCTLAEYFRDIGRNALIIYDDLSKHANAYRQISLLLKRPPGREAYPGDIFFLHARLLERAANIRSHDDGAERIAWSSEFNEIMKPYEGRSGEYACKPGGSLTAIPLIETKQDDYATYIATNIISITDGQIFLSTKIKNEGFLPAINVGISVSRVRCWGEPMKEFANRLRENMAVYRERKRFALFDSIQTDEDRTLIDHGDRLVAYFKQDERPAADKNKQAAVFSMERQVIALFALSKEIFDTVNVRQVHDLERDIWNSVSSDAGLLRQLQQGTPLSEPQKNSLLATCRAAAMNYESMRHA
jgi:F-type H+/Na+-transporting ATPase subunit alpha